MRTHLVALAMFAAFPLATPSFLPAAFAQTSAAKTEHAGTFVKKDKRISGSWSIVEEGGKRIIRFSGDFSAANGPDLKVFLSPTSIADVKGKTAVNGSINLGVLKSTKGAQDYEIPAGVTLSNFKSVLVHCEEYAVLWGGGDL
ncbi:hypothetical protein GC169_09970 [bacterium]|nr:hypothetical protein [bacterium]